MYCSHDDDCRRAALRGASRRRSPRHEPAAGGLPRAFPPAGPRFRGRRLVLSGVLGELGRHAHAEEIARVSSERLPGLSLPTVYATLELFEGLGLIRRVDAGGHAA